MPLLFIRNDMADIFNIDGIVPSAEDAYFVDTNVWYWFSCAALPGFSGAEWKVRRYSRVIERLLNGRARIYHTSLIFAELANVIERRTAEYYRGLKGRDDELKALRQIPEFKELVSNGVNNAWLNVTTISRCIDVSIGSDFASRAKTIFNQYPLDAYDSFFVSLSASHGIVNIITDDADYHTVDGLRLFTLNGAMLR